MHIWPMTYLRCSADGQVSVPLPIHKPRVDGKDGKLCWLKLEIHTMCLANLRGGGGGSETDGATSNCAYHASNV